MNNIWKGIVLKDNDTKIIYYEKDLEPFKIGSIEGTKEDFLIRNQNFVLVPDDECIKGTNLKLSHKLPIVAVQFVEPIIYYRI